MLTRDKLIQHHADGKEIKAGVPAHHPDIGQHVAGSAGKRFVRLAGQRRNIEIHQFDGVTRQHQVCWLDVAMIPPGRLQAVPLLVVVRRDVACIHLCTQACHALHIGMDRRKCSEKLNDALHRLAHRHALPAGSVGGQVFPLHELGHQVEPARRQPAPGVYLDDIRMVERFQRPRFLLQPIQRHGRVVEYLERPGLIPHSVIDLVDPPGTAGGQHGLHFILVVNHLSDLKRRRLHLFARRARCGWRDLGHCTRRPLSDRL